MSTVVELYQLMADHTNPECGKCRVPNSCCDSMYCMIALDYAKHRGVDLQPQYQNDERIPFLHNNKCVVPPHLRPICTLHTCQINGVGFKPGDKAWTERYFEIRDLIDQAEEDQETRGVVAGTDEGLMGSVLRVCDELHSGRQDGGIDQRLDREDQVAGS